MRRSIKRPPTPDGDEERERELTLQEIIYIKMIESGEKEQLKELLRERLIECGWRDESLQLMACKFEVNIYSRVAAVLPVRRSFARDKGRNNVTVDELVHVITQKGRASVPDSVKAELLQRIHILQSAL